MDRPQPVMMAPSELDALKPHTLADLFPPLTGDAFLRLHADIASHGVQSPVVLCDGMILAGRARVGIAAQLRIPCPIIRYEDLHYNGSPLDYVVGEQVHRAHYTTGQRIMIAARIANMKQGERTDLPQLSATWPKVSQDQAAKLLGVGTRSVGRGRYILDHGTPEEIEAAVEGRSDPGPLAASIRARIDGGGNDPEPDDNVDRALARIEDALKAIGTFRGLHVDVVEVVQRLVEREDWDKLNRLDKLLDAHQLENLVADLRAILRLTLDRHEAEMAEQQQDEQPQDEPEVEEAKRRRGAA
jgi:hypothetical protein